MPEQAENQFDLDTAFSTAAQAQAASTADPNANAVEPTQTSEAQAPVTPSPLFERAKQVGLSFGEDIKDESGLAQFLLDQYVQQKPYAQYGQQQLASGHAQPSGKETEHKYDSVADNGPEDFDLDGHFGNLWKANDISPQARWAIENGILALDPETGVYKSRPGFEQMGLPFEREVNDAHLSQKQQLGKFFEGNPYKAVYEALLPAIKHELTKEFQQLNQQSFQGYEQKNFVEKWKADNASWLYQSGTQNLTPQGQAFAEAVNELQQQGITDPAYLAKTAMKLAGINPSPAPQASPAQAPVTQTPAQPAAAERQRDPATGKFLPAQAPEQPTKEQSFLEKAKQRAAASPSSMSHEAVNDHAVVANQGDLDSMFSTAYRQMAAA